MDGPIVRLKICTDSTLILVLWVVSQDLTSEKYYSLRSAIAQLVWKVFSRHRLYQFPLEFLASCLLMKD
jgi:hypothetical protein